MVLAFVLASLPGRGLPRINDITTDPVDPPDPLLDAGRTPRQVVVNHEVGTLKVDAFTSRIRRHKNYNVRIVAKFLLDGLTALTGHSRAAMNGHDRILAAQGLADEARNATDGAT